MTRPLIPCQGLGRIFGHKYRARFDSHVPSGLSGKGLYPEHIEASRTKVYRGDICLRCGNRIDAAVGALPTPPKEVP